MFLLLKSVIKHSILVLYALRNILIHCIAPTFDPSKLKHILLKARFVDENRLSYDKFKS